MSPDPSTFQTWTLPNGIRCVHLEDGRNVGHCGLLIEAGSRDELEEAFHAIEALTDDDVLAVANEVLDPDRLSTLVYFPPKG